MDLSLNGEEGPVPEADEMSDERDDFFDEATLHKIDSPEEEPDPDFEEGTRIRSSRNKSSSPRRGRRQRKNVPVPSSSRVLRSQSPVHDSGHIPDCKTETPSSVADDNSNNEEGEHHQVSKSKRKSSKPRKLKIVISKKALEQGEAEPIKVELEDDAAAECLPEDVLSSDQELEAILDNSSDEDYGENHKSKRVKGRSRKGGKGPSAAGRGKKKRDGEVAQCKVCARTFRSFYLPTHMRTHTGEKPYACDQCAKQFSTECYLKMHRQSCHEDPQAFQCNICQRNLASKGSLREHKRTHSDDRPFQCNICQKVFRQPALLINHVKTHSDLTPYQCEQCGNRYKYKRSMEMHKERIHDGIRKSFACTICNKEFTRKTKLKDHVNWHLGKSPHLCEHCGKRFLSRKTLRTHLLIHEDKKPYPCDVCGKAFRQAHVLKRHVTTHTGIKPFRCDLCSKQFIHRVYLVRHDCPKKIKVVEKMEVVEEEEVPLDEPISNEMPLPVNVPIPIGLGTAIMLHVPIELPEAM